MTRSSEDAAILRQAKETGKRAVPEWIGKTRDTKIPPRVRLRVFEAHGGRCYLSGRLIRPGDKWECEHVIAIVNGGENRESNLRPALKDKHKAKTAADLAEKSKVAKLKAKHLGLRPEGKIKSRGFDRTRTRHFDGTVTRREA